MEQNVSFIDNLFALRDYYQQELEEYERKSNHARKQLNHINELLLDQLDRQHKQSSVSQRFNSKAAVEQLVSESASTTQPRSHKSELTTQAPAATERSATNQPASVDNEPSELTSQLSVSALDSAPVVKEAAPESLNPHQPKTAVEQPRPNSASSEKLEPVQARLTQELVELAAESVRSQLPSPADSELEQPSVDAPADVSPTVQVVELATPKPTEPARAESLVSVPGAESVGLPADNVTGERSLPQQLELPGANSRKFTSYVPPFKTPLLPAYQHLKTKSEAIEKFLQDNAGKIFSIEDITRALHGDLEPEVIRAERPRMYATLNRGVKQGFWQAVPDARHHYTINLKPVEPTVKQPEPLPKLSSNPTTSRRSRYSDSMLPRYRQLKFSEAVATVVQEKVGQVLTPELVTRELYGNVSANVSAKELTIFQIQVRKALWAGAKQGRWQRVPGQYGQYTLDLKQLT